MSEPLQITVICSAQPTLKITLKNYLHCILGITTTLNIILILLPIFNNLTTFIGLSPILEAFVLAVLSTMRLHPLMPIILPGSSSVSAKYDSLLRFLRGFSSSFIAVWERQITFFHGLLHGDESYSIVSRMPGLRSNKLRVPVFRKTFIEIILLNMMRSLIHYLLKIFYHIYENLHRLKINKHF